MGPPQHLGAQVNVAFGSRIPFNSDADSGPFRPEIAGSASTPGEAWPQLNEAVRDRIAGLVEGAELSRDD